MSDFDPTKFVFTTVWTGTQQETSVFCGACGTDVAQWTGAFEGASIDMAEFDALCRAHREGKHGE